jgi:hypothetical protein
MKTEDRSGRESTREKESEKENRRQKEIESGQERE